MLFSFQKLWPNVILRQSILQYLFILESLDQGKKYIYDQLHIFEPPKISLNFVFPLYMKTVYIHI